MLQCEHHAMGGRQRHPLHELLRDVRWFHEGEGPVINVRHACVAYTALHADESYIYIF